VHVVERLLNLLAFLLACPGPVTPDEIRANVAGYGQDHPESFRRMFERDKARIRSIGIPIEVGPSRIDPAIPGYRVLPARFGAEGVDRDERERLGGIAACADPELARAVALKLAVETLPSSEVTVDLGLDPTSVTAIWSAVEQGEPLVVRVEEQEHRIVPVGFGWQEGRWGIVAADGTLWPGVSSARRIGRTSR